MVCRDVYEVARLLSRDHARPLCSPPDDGKSNNDLNLKNKIK